MSLLEDQDTGLTAGLRDFLARPGGGLADEHALVLAESLDAGRVA
ncbi:hypothetical protein [Actinocorallia longicatena]|uniref:Polyprenyl synthetase family protein n=1 Tax=Actinocorallia longicatena TaxID=111803 RepID=A0ABP6Q9D8_9ACTN